MATADRIDCPASTGDACLFSIQLPHGYDVSTRGEGRSSLALHVLSVGVGVSARLQATTSCCGCMES